MADDAPNEPVSAVMRQINQAWLDGRVDDLLPFVHPEIVMVLPGFSGRVQDRETLLAGFRDFRANSRIREFKEFDPQVDVVGKTAVVSFRYEMVYEQNAKRSRAAGRDVWVFEKQDSAWVAVWRTMLDMEEQPA
jgi:hypothetical protein